MILIKRKDLFTNSVALDTYYFLTQSLSSCFEHSLTMLPSFIITAQLVSPGVEGTMLSLSTSLIKLNQFTIREMVGILINDIWVHVTTKNLSDIFYLIEISLVCAFIPIILIYLMVPTREETQAYQKMKQVEAEKRDAQNEKAK